MDMLQSIQDFLGQATASNRSAVTPATGPGSGDLSSLINPAMIGGLAGALLSGKGALGGILKGALVVGGGSYLWNKYKDRFIGPNAAATKYSSPDPVLQQPEKRAGRLIRAMVYAAKSDGHIDDRERTAIQTQLNRLNLGSEAANLVQQAIDEPLNPGLIADGVTDGQEAMRLYTLSRAIIDIDQPAEKQYLESLAQALKIPSDVGRDIESEIHAHA